LFLATTKVEDFDRWWRVFSTTSLEKRKQHGSKASHSFRDPTEEGRARVLFDWDAEDWQNFISDPDVPAILQEAGHATRPRLQSTPANSTASTSPRTAGRLTKHESTPRMFSTSRNP
jgi:hypothetical protein